MDPADRVLPHPLLAGARLPGTYGVLRGHPVALVLRGSRGRGRSYRVIGTELEPPESAFDRVDRVRVEVTVDGIAVQVSGVHEGLVVVWSMDERAAEALGARYDQRDGVQASVSASRLRDVREVVSRTVPPRDESALGSPDNWRRGDVRLGWLRLPGTYVRDAPGSTRRPMSTWQVADTVGTDGAMELRQAETLSRGRSGDRPTSLAGRDVEVVTALRAAWDTWDVEVQDLASDGTVRVAVGTGHSAKRNQPVWERASVRNVPVTRLRDLRELVRGPHGEEWVRTGLLDVDAEPDRLFPAAGHYVEQHALVLPARPQAGGWLVDDPLTGPAGAAFVPAAQVERALRVAVDDEGRRTVVELPHRSLPHRLPPLASWLGRRVRVMGLHEDVAQVLCLDPVLARAHARLEEFDEAARSRSSPYGLAYDVPRHELRAVEALPRA